MANQVLKKTTINDCKEIILDQHNSNRQGSLSVVDNQYSSPFNVKRVFYIYDIPGGESRGAHAHRTCHQFIIAASGSFEVSLDDGQQKKTILLNRPYVGLSIPPGIWASETNFASGSVCLVLASEKYDENDYIRSYNEFLMYKKQWI